MKRSEEMAGGMEESFAGHRSGPYKNLDGVSAEVLLETFGPACPEHLSLMNMSSDIRCSKDFEAENSLSMSHFFFARWLRERFCGAWVSRRTQSKRRSQHLVTAAFGFLNLQFLALF